MRPYPLNITMNSPSLIPSSHVWRRVAIGLTPVLAVLILAGPAMAQGAVEPDRSFAGAFFISRKADDSVEILGSILPEVEISARHIYSFLGAGFFLGVPFAVWLRCNRPGGLFYGTPGHNAESLVLLVSYVAVVIGELLMVYHRIGFDPFVPNSVLNQTLGFFFCGLFVLINTTVAMMTASYAAPKYGRTS